MARIRTIKPEFWTDEKLTECSITSRLLFLGLLNFADDNGNLQRSSKRIKMQVFPADNIDCEPLLSELFAHGVLVEYLADNEKYIHIKGFRKHQLINRPSATNIPQCSLTEDSLSTHGVLTDGREGKGEEGKGKDKELLSSATQNDSCPHSKIIELYHQHLPTMPRVAEWTPARKTKLRTRWNEKSERQNLEWWEKFFGYVAESDFLCGRSKNEWTACNLEWLITPSNFVKVLEGNYENRGVAA